MKLVVVLIALLLLVWLLLGSARRRTKSNQYAQPRSRSSRPAVSVEGMIACAHCGVHLPSSAALLARGNAYCSAAHRDSGPSAQ